MSAPFDDRSSPSSPPSSSVLGDWEERYRYVIDLGRDLAPLTDAERSDANKVRGCASQVWLVTEPQADGRLTFRGDSDAHIVRGLIAILLRLYSGRTPAGDPGLRRQGGVRDAGPGAARCRRSAPTACFDGASASAATPRRARLGASALGRADAAERIAGSCRRTAS